MHNWNCSREKAILLKFFETFALLLVSQLGPGPSAILFVNGRAHSLHVGHSALLSPAIIGLISAYPGLTYNRNTSVSEKATSKPCRLSHIFTWRLVHSHTMVSSETPLHTKLYLWASSGDHQEWICRTKALLLRTWFISGISGGSLQITSDPVLSPACSLWTKIGAHGVPLPAWFLLRWF